MNSTDCLFCKLQNVKENIIFENENLYVILDRFPLSNRHLLIIPKIHRPTLRDLADERISETILVAKELSKNLNLEKYNILQNNLNGQMIPHYHVHLIGCNETGGLEINGGKQHLNLSDEEYSKLSKEIKAILNKQ